MPHLETKYINLISSRLRNFKRKNSNLWNFSCMYCGDSDKVKSKSRGYLITKGQKVYFYCHNCGKSSSFKNFIREIDPIVYNDYIKEYLREHGLHKPTEVEEFVSKMKKPEFLKLNPALDDLTKISKLPSHHPAKKYIVSRMIPTPVHSKLFFSSDFKKWVNSIVPGKFSDIRYDESRIVIPFLNRSKQMIGLQGRTLNPNNQLRYITIMLDEEQPRIYGFDSVDLTQKIYVFEGPIDSMFIPNSIASAGGDIIRELTLLNKDKKTFVIVYDNEPRNKETVKKIEHAIDEGFDVCIWPSGIEEKDINDMVLKRVPITDHVPTEKIELVSNELKSIIDSNTFRGLEAKLRLSQWKK